MACVSVKQGEQHQFSSTGKRVGVSSAEDLLASVYSALCAHTWPPNGVDGYCQKHLTNVCKPIPGTTGTLTGTSGHPLRTLRHPFVTDLPLTFPLASFSADLVHLNPEPRNPAGSPHRSVPGEKRPHFRTAAEPFVSPRPGGLFSMQM